MAEAKSPFQVIKDYFGGERPVSVDELKKLTKEERAELAEGAAKEMGLKPVPQADGSVKFG